MFGLDALELTLDLVIGNRILHRNQFSSFCFGAGSGWSQFSVLLTHIDGGIYELCPIVPKHLFISREVFEALRQSVVIHRHGVIDAPDSSQVAVMPSSEATQAQRARNWLDNCWKRQTQKDDFFFVGPAAIDEVLSPRVQGPLSIVPEPEPPRHSEEPSAASTCSIITIGSSAPASVIAISFSSGHVDILLDVDTCRPSWRSVVDSRILDNQPRPSLLFLHRVDLGLLRPDRSLSFLP
jgi:hypothetical protein